MLSKDLFTRKFLFPYRCFKSQHWQNLWKLLVKSLADHGNHVPKNFDIMNFPRKFQEKWAISNVFEWIGICLKFQKSDISNLESWSVNFTDQMVYRPEMQLQLPVNVKAAVECRRLVVFQWNFTQITVILYSLQ